MKNLTVSAGLVLHDIVGKPYRDTLRAGLEFHKAHGFGAADLMLPSIADGGKYDVKMLDGLLRDSEEVGVPVRLCHLPFGTAICRDESLLPEFCRGMTEAIQAAAYLGVDYAVLHPNTVTVSKEEYKPDVDRERVLSHLAPFAELAAKVGVRLAVENTRLVLHDYPTRRYCQYAEELCDIADTLGISVCWDFGHANLSGIKQSEALAMIGKRLAVLHVNDNRGGDDDHLAPFMGTVDWRDAMHGLALAGFDGILNFEVASYDLPEAVRGSYAHYLTSAAEVLLGYIE